MAPTQPQKPARRPGVQSVGIGLKVLEALGDFEGPATLGDIAKASGLSASQAHRYLTSLVAAGMAQQDMSKGRYDMGPAALRLGLGALARVDAFSVADSAIKDFSLATESTVLLAALGPAGPLIVRQVMGAPPVSTSLVVGSPLSLLHSATGHIFLAFRSERETRAMVARETREARKLRPVDVEGLRRQVRTAGYSAINGSLIPGLRAIAAPIFDLQGESVLAATVLRSEAFDPSGDGEVRDQLIAVCAAVSASIGGRIPTP